MKPLSNQAQWYLNGFWPVMDCKINGMRPEPKAMQELVDKGIAEPVKGIMSEGWALKAMGKEVKGCSKQN